MNEERNNGRGIFYGVIGVATLVVAIIGATFAYFSAQSATNYVDNIEGGTNDAVGSISLTVTRVYPDKTTYATTTGVNGLVPANIPGTTDGLDTAISNAIGSNCVDNTSGTAYVGCHVYEISAEADSDISSATITMDSLELTVPDATDWHYAIFEKSGTTASNAAPGSFPAVSSGSTSVSNIQVYQGGLNATTLNRYLIIYITNQNATQNREGDGSTNQTGTYEGTVSFQVAGGNEVKATFSA